MKLAGISNWSDMVYLRVRADWNEIENFLEAIGIDPHGLEEDSSYEDENFILILITRFRMIIRFINSEARKKFDEVFDDFFEQRQNFNGF